MGPIWPARELSLTVRFRQKQQNFVLIPASDSRGLRMRLLRPQASGQCRRGRHRALLAANFAVNLDSSLEPFDDRGDCPSRQRTG